MSKEKICAACYLALPLSNFYSRRASKDGLQSSCKSCTRDAQREYSRKISSTVKVEEKHCPKCLKIKPAAEYFSNRHRKDGLSPYCKPCWVAYTTKRDGKAYRQRVARKSWLKTYGLTPDQYEELLIVQKGVCAICGQTCSTGKNLAVDHCHNSSKVRGLLCDWCNKGVGQFKDDPKLLRKAADYLEATKACKV